MINVLRTLGTGDERCDRKRQVSQKLHQASKSNMEQALVMRSLPPITRDDYSMISMLLMQLPAL